MSRFKLIDGIVRTSNGTKIGILDQDVDGNWLFFPSSEMMSGAWSEGALLELYTFLAIKNASSKC